MAPQVLISVEEYLATSFEDQDLEYLDGELVETNVGEIDHAALQTLIARAGFWRAGKSSTSSLSSKFELGLRRRGFAYRISRLSTAQNPPAASSLSRPS